MKKIFLVFITSIVSFCTFAQFPYKHIRVTNGTDLSVKVRCGQETSYFSLKTGGTFHCSNNLGLLHISIEGKKDGIVHAQHCSSVADVLLVDVQKDASLQMECMEAARSLE